MSPDNRQHRGAHPADKSLFAPTCLNVLREATFELSWLLSRGYSMNSSLKIVGDRHALTERQRLAVSRAACTDESRQRRLAHCLPLDRIKNEDVIIDGFNLLITVEAALGGGVLIICRDGCIRDMSSVHGSYRSVLETERAVRLIGEVLETLEPKSVKWLLDKPISNSGRLSQRIRDAAIERAWMWSVEVVFNPDKQIVSEQRIAVTSDSTVLDGVARWVNFSQHLITQHLSHSWMVDLSILK